MSNTKSKRHIHKYHKVLAGAVKVWACALPDCNHHMPPHYANMVEGKSSYCWNCGNQMILDSENMKDDKPICIGCKTGVNDDITPEMVELMRQKGLV